MPYLIDIAADLSRELKDLTFGPPVSFVYDPTDYASGILHSYLERYGKSPKKVILVGMNPGPWGMVQTGVPFGEVHFVKDWLGLKGEVGAPARQHPKRPVEGFACTRSEVSGRRLWGWAREKYGEARAFFRDFFVLNYCPLAFFDSGGKNITPDKLRAADRARLYVECDEALRGSVIALSPEIVLGIGRFAADRSSLALSGLDVNVGRITHPSPANPAANRGWKDLAERQMREMGIELP